LFQRLAEDRDNVCFGEDLITTVNLSGCSINEEGFLGFIKEQFDRYAVSPLRICFEVTETVAVTNLAQAAVFIEELKMLGCLFALDDFGSGLSSFGYLKNLPVDYLKIDGQFVRDMVDDPIDAAMVNSINQIGQVMGMKTIAEFVENDAILERLREAGVDYAQGYGLARPVPLEDFRSEKLQSSR
ncbi:MAG TPA: EAL domain-containing protein, partial [Gammaproteobacteria bacterium]|nr:EAL domain-containing protein [Gammaproteobacteria bacterium]